LHILKEITTEIAISVEQDEKRPIVTFYTETETSNYKLQFLQMVMTRESL